MTNAEAITWIWKDMSIDVRKSKDITKTEMALKMAYEALGTIEQIRWERDTAIQQLRELGYGLGEKPSKSKLACFEDCNSCAERCRAWQNGWDARHDRYAWHDLRKNPKDLPVTGEYVEIVYDYRLKDLQYYEVTYRDADGSWVGSDEYDMDYWSILAWREIYPFEEEEKL